MTTLPIANGNWHYRKDMARNLAKGIGKLRVFGTRGHWKLAVELPHRLVPTSLKDYPTMKAAVIQGIKKYGIKATQVKVALPAAA